MLKYILFDLDGTLLNTNDIIIECFKLSLKKVLNKDITLKDLIPILGRDLVSQMEYFSKTKKEELLHTYKYIYRQQKESMVEIFPGIEKMLSDIKEMGCKIAITTSKGKNGAMHGINKFNLDKYIDFIITGYEVENSKPHPECIYKTMEFFDCSKDQMIIIGDSESDILSGKNAGIKTVLVSWTLIPLERFKNIEPDYILEKPNDIIKIIKAN